MEPSNGRFTDPAPYEMEGCCGAALGDSLAQDEKALKEGGGDDTDDEQEKNEKKKMRSQAAKADSLLHTKQESHTAGVASGVGSSERQVGKQVTPLVWRLSQRPKAASLPLRKVLRLGVLVTPLVWRAPQRERQAQ